MKSTGMKALLLALKGDRDTQCHAAKAWLRRNPSAGGVPLRHWEALQRIAASEATFDAYVSRIHRHLHEAEHRPGGNRWEKPDLTQSLLAALRTAGTVKADALPPAVQAGLDGLEQADRDSVVQVWKRDRARDFLRAVIVTLKNKQATGGGEGEETT